MKGADNTKFYIMMGLPQGSVRSPLRFNLFINDIFVLVNGKKVKFADDGMIWQTGSDAKLLEETLEMDLVEIREWTKKWRMKLIIEKENFAYLAERLTKNCPTLLLKWMEKILKEQIHQNCLESSWMRNKISTNILML